MCIMQLKHIKNEHINTNNMARRRRRQQRQEQHKRSAAEMDSCRERAAQTTVMSTVHSECSKSQVEFKIYMEAQRQCSSRPP